MSSAKDTNAPVIEHRAEPTPGNDRMLDGVENQVKANSTDTENPLADFGNSASAMIGDSFNDVRNRVSSISPGEVVDNVRGRVRSITNGNGNGNGNGDYQGNERATEQDNSPSDEEIQEIENMEREKIVEFLQEKHMSNANLRRGK